MEHDVFNEVVLPTLYLIIVIIGVIGNLMVITVVYKSPSVREQSSSYLFANLAIADLMFNFLEIPSQVVVKINHSDHSILGEVGCHIYGSTFDLTVTISIYTIVLMSFDRLFAIVFYSSKLRTLKNTRIAIVIVWILSLITAISAIFTHTLQPIKSNSTMMVCTHLPGDDGNIVTIFEAMLHFVVPFTILVILYVIIIWKLMKSKMENGQINDQKVRQISKTITMVVTVFFVCWLPYCAFLFLRVSIN